MQHLNTIQAIILGIIQGLTEFLPISSSGHLILTREVFQFPDPGKTFDIIMHFGTLIALIIYFWNDLADLAKGFIEEIKQGRYYGTKKSNFLWFLIVSTIPGGLFGLLFKDRLENLKSIYVISGLLIAFGIILLASDRLGEREKILDDFTWKDAIIVGLAQAIALFPGVSRSGITITAALFLGFSRETSARYSFLISIPLIGGISAYGVMKMLSNNPGGGAILVCAAGLIASIVTGWLCIRFLLDYLKKGTFLWFVVYRVGLGLLLIIMGLSGIIK